MTVEPEKRNGIWYDNNMRKQYKRRKTVHQRYRKRRPRAPYRKRSGFSLPAWATKKTLLMAGVAIAIVIVFIAVLAGNGTAPDIEIHAAEDDGSPPDISIAVADDMTINVYDTEKEQLVTMGLEEYIVHVTAGEMPASYESEALKAQSIAARTYAVRKMVQLGGTGCSAHEGADVCTSSAHCQAYMSEERMAETWGADTELYLEKICNAVEDTASLVMTYNGEYIDALYHASSGGRTEDSVNVFGGDLPYLVGVESPNEGTGAGNVAEKTISYEDAADAILAEYPNAGITADTLRDNMEILSRFESGRVEALKIGNVQITGQQARSLFGLNSANFTIAFGDSEMTFHTSGYGHGVGMSQAGANAMAREGSDFREILTHYYTGIEIEKINE